MAASYNVVSQLPQHIVDTYPQFADFLTQYYAFLNEDGNPENILSNILKYGDIDTTIDSFKEHILDELMGDIPNNILADRALLAKHIKELYSKTGTEDSYRLLFRILFNKEIDVYYPGEQVIKTSSDVWKQDISFICHVVNTVPVDTVKLAINNTILVTIGNKKIPVYVYDVVQLTFPHTGFNIFEFFIRKDFNDNFENATTFTINKLSNITIINGGSRYKDADTVEINGINGGGAQASLTTTNGKITDINLFENGAGYISNPIISINSETGVGAYLTSTITSLYTGEILISPAKIEVIRSATGYRIGSAYPVGWIYSTEGYVGIDLTLQVNELNADGTVKYFSILDFGQYYPAKFYKTIDINPTVAQLHCGINTATGEIENVTIDFAGKGYTVAPTLKVIGDGFGAEITVSLSGGTVISPVIVNAGYGYTVTPTIVLDDSSIVITGSNSKLRKYQGSYDKTTGTLSSDMAIYDGYYYQTFSYELIVNELFDDYKSVLKKLVHPTSYAVWSAYDLQKVAQVQVNSYKIDIERGSIFSETIAIAESDLVFDVTKVLEDFTNIGETFSVGFNLSPIVESPTITSDSDFTIAVSLATINENMTTSESIPLFDVGKNIPETIVNIETIEVDFIKDSILESVSTSSNEVFSFDFDKDTIIDVVSTSATPEVFEFDFVKDTLLEFTLTSEVFEVDYIKSLITESVSTTSGEVVTPVLTTYTDAQVKRGYFGGGYGADFAMIGIIDGFRYDTEALVSTSAMLNLPKIDMAGVNSNTHGYFGGGTGESAPESLSDISGIRFGAETTINTSSTLTTGASLFAGVSSVDDGYFAGGIDSTFTTSNNIDKLEFFSETVTALASYLKVRRSGLTGVNSSTDGYFASGAGSGGANKTTVDKITFSTETVSSVTATLSPARAQGAAVNSATKGYFAGGYTTNAIARIDVIDFSTEAITNSGGTLSIARQTLTGIESATIGYFCGGTDNSFSYSDVINGIDFSTNTVTTPAATLSTTTSNLAGVNPRI